MPNNLNLNSLIEAAFMENLNFSFNMRGMNESVEHHGVGINGATSQETKAAIHQNYHKTFKEKNSTNITTKRGI